MRVESRLENNIRYTIRKHANVTYWTLNDMIHRLGAPAMYRADGTKVWFFKNQIHRLDGPAIEYSNGIKEWFYHNKIINCSSQEEFEKWLKLKAFW